MSTPHGLETATVVWDLQALYPLPLGTEIQHDMFRCREMAETLSAEIAGRVATLDAASISQVVVRLEAIDSLIARLGAFAFLHFITQTGDAAASALLQQVEELEAAIGKLTVFFRLEWNRLDDDVAQAHLHNPALRRYRHYLEVMRQFAPHQRSCTEEELLQELKPVGRNAWNVLFEKVMGQLRFGRQGRTEEEVLSDLYHPQRKIRLQGATEMTEGLTANAHILVHIFNTLAAEKMISDRIRRYPAWDSAMHLANEVHEQTVSTLIGAVCSRYDIVHRYYHLKRELLGYSELFDYDRYAPVSGGEESLVTWRRCRQIVLEAFADFSPEMAVIAERFFADNWIHAPTQQGKRGGAFAHPCVPEVHPYIMVNYTGNIRDVATVAHELGHGIHQCLAAEQGFYNSDTPLVLAETASVFAELLVFQTQLKWIESREARRAFICQKLESIFATVFRQVALYQFEAGMHDGRRQHGELSIDHLSSLWLETQRPMFGDAVNLREEYGIWWAYISHFLSTPGYVYSYAFGELLVLTLYARYREQGEVFVGNYLDLLRAGGKDSPYELLRPFGIDLNDPDFWQAGLALIDQMVTDAQAEC